MAAATSSPTASSSADLHRNALDGIRGVAVTLVILFHSLRFYSGWAGVQIFYVLSGFLITSILLKDSDLSVELYLKRFYWRRALRIFPLYFGYLLVLAVAYAVFKAPGPAPPINQPLWVLPPRIGLTTFGHDWPYLLTYTLNFRRIVPAFGASNPYYGRFWSLAVEEQFYLVWPLLVYYFPRKYLSALVAATLAIAPICRALTPYVVASIFHGDPAVHDQAYLGSTVYYLTPGQMDAFAVGAALVLFGNRLRKRPIAIFAICTLLLLIAGQLRALLSTGRLALDTGFGYDVNMIQGFQHIWGYTLINFWAGSLILVASSKNLIAALLAHPVLAYLGRISYGMYVYHHIILFAGLGMFGGRLNSDLGFAGYFVCVVLVSDLSYRLYENRFLKLKDSRFSRPRGFAKSPEGNSNSIPAAAVSSSATSAPREISA